MRKIVLILLVAFLNLTAFSQNGVFKGKVTDPSNEPLPGVTVQLKGTSKGVITDVDGKFAVAEVKNGDVVIFRFVGMNSKEVKADLSKEAIVVLQPDVVGLEEVVAVGYGTMVKENITSSVTAVDMEMMPSTQNINISSSIQGLVPGVSVTNTGLPGSEPIVQIRGVKSFNNVSPLYIIDGIPTSDSRELNPGDVESIQVLKDASAAAIYGSRAANGVIIITTKRGKKGVLTVDFSARGSMEQIAKRLDVMNAAEYAAMNNLAHDNAKMPHMPGADAAFDPTIDTDWQDAYFKNGYTQDYNINVSGGSEQSQFMLSGGYYKNEGTTIGPWFEKATFSSSSNHQVKWFEFGHNIKFSRSSGKEQVGVPFVDMVRLPPVIPVYDENNPGGYGYGNDNVPNYGSNPIGLQELNDNMTYTNKVLGNVYAQINFSKNLKYRVSYGVDHYNNFSQNLSKIGSIRYSNPLMPSSLSETRREYYKSVQEHTLNFDKKFDRHDVGFLAGVSMENENYNETWAYGEELAQNPVTGSYYSVLNSTKSQQKVGGYRWETVLLSQFGRINYAFDNKYLVTATVRRDGSSKFSKGNRWGIFPSFSMGWKLHEEDFMKSIEAISMLKIRYGFGQLGGQETGAYAYMGTINTNVNYAIGTGQEVLNGATQIEITNHDLTWQTTTSSNIGVDLGLYDNRVFFTAEYYKANTTDALIPVDIPLSPGHFGGNPDANVGEFMNSGFEFALSYKEMSKPFKYSVTGTLTTLHNEVISLKNNPNGIVSWLTKTEEGSSIGTFYLIEADGIFQNAEEVLAHTSNVEGTDKVIQPKAKPGDVRYVDFNSDGTINNDDRQLMGSPFPKVQYGLNFTAAYKMFDVAVFFYGVAGNQLYNVPRFWLERTDENDNYSKGLNPWTAENPSTTTPRPVFGSAGANNNIQTTDRWLENGDYLKLKTLELGFTLPKSISEKAKIANMRIFLSGQNLFTFTKYTGLDPEVTNGNIRMRGVDDGSFPNVRSLSCGVQLKF